MAPMAQMASVLWEAHLAESVRTQSGGGRTIDVRALTQPGTVVWTDPATLEERYSRPGDPSYSTALFFAHGIIGDDGTLQPWL